ADGAPQGRGGGRIGPAHRRRGGAGGGDRLRRPGLAAPGARLGVGRSGAHPAALDPGRRDPAGRRRPRRPDDPDAGGAEAGRGHRPVRRAAVRPGRLAGGAELAGVSAALELTGVTARLGGRVTLEDVSLDVEPGEVLGLVGPNGAGKTTLIRAALGLTPLAAG